MAKRKPESRKPARRPISADDLLQLRWVARPRVSPDGSNIVFVRKHVGDENDYVTNLWMVQTSGGTPRQFTSGNSDSSPCWSPDGSRIAFVRAERKRCPQIFTIGAGGGEAVRLTDFPEGSIGRMRVSPDGRLLAVAFREQHAERTERAEEDRKKTGQSEPPRVIDDWWYRLDGDGYFEAQRFRLYLVDTSSGEHRLLYGKDTMGGMDFDFSPDSKELVVSTNRDRLAMIRPWKDELLRIDVGTGKTRPIAGLAPGPKSSVRWSPDGGTIAFAGREGKDGSYSVENLDLFVCKPGGGKAKSLTASTDYCLLAVSIGDTSEAAFDPNFRFSPDGKRILLQLGWHGETHVASVRTVGGPIEFLTAGKIDLEMGSLSADGKQLALSIGSHTRPPEVAVLDVVGRGTKPKMLTDFNGRLLKRLHLSKPAGRWIAAEDGHKVQLWRMMPPDGAPKRRTVPGVLEIHGGPHAQYGSGFFHEFQLLAAQGYAVFYCNPRGSKGYGRDHCAAIRGNWGGADWTDIQAVIARMKADPAIDSKRMAVMGGSYGGYMTNWAIGHSNDFAAAVSDRCVSNLVSFGGNSDFVEAPDDYFPGNCWDRPEARWNQSPMKHIGNATTPTLIIHSEGDLRCNIEQSEQVFAALKLLKVPTRLVRYPRSTSHGMSRKGPPDLRIHRLRQILDWLGKYLG